MRYHYEKPEIYLSMYGKRYLCEHPVYDSCTLFEIGLIFFHVLLLSQDCRAGRSPPGSRVYCMMTTLPASIRSVRLALK